ncbi:hypothetical protein [Aggregatibacter actinomycetemcomitans]|nr:hypothetical protein [Aggregatibacter actinomycetemcomitans]MBN6063309.1 hypothetical protein [Aggregatibacter actinomycetemcomitans]MBN6081026.1 hypothetical protein [Aggregatibacter actinomycetemcomitans]MBN6084678.1 hypothetical protein [Aggregatibacter actinomycetemcomitans]
MENEAQEFKQKFARTLDIPQTESSIFPYLTMPRKGDIPGSNFLIEK